MNSNTRVRELEHEVIILTSRINQLTIENSHLKQSLKEILNGKFDGDCRNFRDMYENN